MLILLDKKFLLLASEIDYEKNLRQKNIDLLLLLPADQNGRDGSCF